MARIQLAGTVEVPVNRFRELVRSGRIDCRQTIPATGEVAYLVSPHVIGVDLPREADLTADFDDGAHRRTVVRPGHAAINDVAGPLRVHPRQQTQDQQPHAAPLGPGP